VLANARVRLKAENDRLRQELGLLQEELRIKDARMASIERRSYAVVQLAPPATARERFALHVTASC
jgi:hypothetical protein